MGQAAAKGLLGTVASWVLEKIMEIFDDYKRKKEEETRKDMERKIDEAFQELKEKMEALQESFRKLQEYIKNELDVLRRELEKSQGKKEEEISKALESRICEKYQKLFETIGTLEKDLQQLLESAQHELQLLREGLEK